MTLQRMFAAFIMSCVVRGRTVKNSQICPCRRGLGHPAEDLSVLPSIIWLVSQLQSYRGGCNVFVGRPSNMKTQTAKENSLASSLEEGLLTKHVARLKDINIPKIKLCSSFSCCCKKIQVISVLVKRINLR